MRPSKQEIIATFRRECPIDIGNTFSDEGLGLIFDIMEKEARMDEDELEFTPENVCTIYCEDSYTEFSESVKLNVDFTKCQNETEQQNVLKKAIAKDRQIREAVVAFTSEHRIVSYLEVFGDDADY